MTTSLWNDEQEKPLQHLRIVDLTIMLPGPYLTRLLAQYGADVIKVEGLPDGDYLRHLRNTTAFDMLNQGKRSLALNLKSEQGIDIVKQLADEADVFVENFREGVMDRLGLGYAELSEHNPDLIYLSLRGMSGKFAAQAAHDLNFIAASGCGEWFLENDAPNFSTHFGDIIGGMMVPALKLLTHLANPERRGMHLVSYMDEGFRALYMVRGYETFRAASLPPAQRHKHGVHIAMKGDLPHSRYYKCKDEQWISLNAIQDKHWIAFCEAVDKPAWKDQMWDKDLVSDVEKLFRDKPSNYWEGLAASREICLFRVLSWEDHLSLTDSKTQLEKDPLTWAGFQSNPSLSASPELGRDTFAILHSLGMSNKDISDGLQSKTFYQPESKG